MAGANRARLAWAYQGRLIMLTDSYWLYHDQDTALHKFIKTHRRNCRFNYIPVGNRRVGVWACLVPQAREELRFFLEDLELLARKGEVEDVGHVIPYLRKVAGNGEAQEAGQADRQGLDRAEREGPTRNVPETVRDGGSAEHYRERYRQARHNPRTQRARREEAHPHHEADGPVRVEGEVSRR